jgi:hypothetical protein
MSAARPLSHVPAEHGSVEHGSVEHGSVEHGSVEHGSVEPTVAPVYLLRTEGQALDPEVDHAIAELLAFEALRVHELPLPVTLVLFLPGFGRIGVGPAAREDCDLHFDAAEWRALVEGVRADRVWPRELCGFAARKLADEAFRITAAEALAGAQPDPDGGAWTVAQVVDRLGAGLVEVQLGGA